MLSTNIKTIRKLKGFSQEEFAVRLNVVRQTVSKWENGLSVPDADMLISISEVLETPVSTLLGETNREPDDMKAISEKLEAINLQLVRQKTVRLKRRYWLLISICTLTIILLVILVLSHSPYQSWDYSDPETAVLGVGFHSFEWLFVRIAPFVLVGGGVGIILTLKQLRKRS